MAAADASIDRVLMVHSLEFWPESPRETMKRSGASGARRTSDHRGTESPRRLGTDGAHALLGAALFRGQLTALLRETNFTPGATTEALFFPPSKRKLPFGCAAVWNGSGRSLWPSFGGDHRRGAEAALSGLPVAARASRRVFVPCWLRGRAQHAQSGKKAPLGRSLLPVTPLPPAAPARHVALDKYHRPRYWLRPHSSRESWSDESCPEKPCAAFRHPGHRRLCAWQGNMRPASPRSQAVVERNAARASRARSRLSRRRHSISNATRPVRRMRSRKRSRRFMGSTRQHPFGTGRTNCSVFSAIPISPRRRGDRHRTRISLYRIQINRVGGIPSRSRRGRSVSRRCDTRGRDRADEDRLHAPIRQIRPAPISPSRRSASACGLARRRPCWCRCGLCGICTRNDYEAGWSSFRQPQRW